jgi:protein required for attachment to host cells
MKRLHRFERVVVFDGSRLAIYRNGAQPPALDLKLESSRSQDNPPTREQGNSPPPRTNDSMGRRSAMESPDYHQIAEDRFTREIAVDLAADLANGVFAHMVIVAPPAALAVFRKSASADLRKAIVLEINKDLTKHPPKEIAGIVAKALDEAPG